MKSPRLNTIGGRLSAVAFFFIIGTSLAMGMAGYRLTLNFEQQRFHEHFSLLADYLARNAELGLLLDNPLLLENLAANMLAVSDVREVEIRDQRDQVAVSRSSPGEGEVLGRVSTPVFSETPAGGEAPFFGLGRREQLGVVQLAYSHAGLERLKRQLALRFVAISLALGLVPVFLYWWLARAITAPLAGLVRVAGRVSGGDLAVRAEGGTLRETRTLATAINEMLEALARQRRELEEAQAEMVRRRSLAEVGKFSLVVAHEIKNPLAIIKGSLEMLAKEPPPETRTRLLDFTDEELGRINRLVEDFLAFARPLNPDPRPVAVAEFIAGLLNRFRLLVGTEQAAELESAWPLLPATPVPAGELSCDPQLLERALLNILANALEAAGSVAALEFGVEKSAESWKFTVADRGPGLAPEQLDRLFEPFFSTKAKGSGLGLAIAHEIVVAHGGTLTAANRPAGGAIFTITLPAAGSVEEENHGSHSDR